MKTRTTFGGDMIWLEQRSWPLDLAGKPLIVKRGDADSQRQPVGSATPPYSSNRSLLPSLPFGAIDASGATACKPGSRKRLTIG
jgi:hypothetical protein